MREPLVSSKGKWEISYPMDGSQEALGQTGLGAMRIGLLRFQGHLQYMGEPRTQCKVEEKGQADVLMLGHFTDPCPESQFSQP